MRQRLLLPLIFLFLLASCGDQDTQYNGYIDTDLIYLASDYPGRLEHLLVKRGQRVQKNQLLFKLEQASEHFNLEMSQFNEQNLLAQRQELLNQVQYNETNYRRTARVQKQNAASQNDLDLAQEQLDIAKNKLLGLDAKIKSNEVDIAYKNWQVLHKENHAPQTGIIFDTYYTQSEYVQAGQPIVALITAQSIKAIFFVPEKALGEIRLNQKINLSNDAISHLATGHISYISQIAQYTPPIIYSREEREKLVFRVEARLDKPKLDQLHLGQPVTLELVP